MTDPTPPDSLPPMQPPEIDPTPSDAPEVDPGNAPQEIPPPQPGVNDGTAPISPQHGRADVQSRSIGAGI